MTGLRCSMWFLDDEWGGVRHFCYVFSLLEIAGEEELQDNQE
jgi:hypothetical protein